MNKKSMLPKIIIPIIILGFAFIVWKIIPNQSKLLIDQNKGTYFPTVSGSNLLRQEYTVPADLEGELNIIFVAFLENQQPIVNTWVEFAEATEMAEDHVAYYELPTIDDSSALFRAALNEGMRAGIPNPKARERTITLYIDTQIFMQTAGIPSKSEMHTLLINREGEILWRTTGRFNSEKGNALQNTISAYQK